MKIEMDANSYINGVKEFYKTVTESSVKKIKKSLIMFLILGVLFIVIGIIDKEMRKLMITCGIIVLVSCALLALTPLINKKTIRKLDQDNKIEKVEITILDSISIKAFFIGGSVNVAQYDFKDIEKLSETSNYYLMYVNKYSAIAISKENIENKVEFVQVFKDNNVTVEENNNE